MLVDDTSKEQLTKDLSGGFADRDRFYAARELEPIRLLGQGGYGEVWLVRRRHIDLNLAVKFFMPHPFVAGSEEKRAKARQRIIREGHLLGLIRHANIVRIVDFSIVDGEPVLVLEYIEGESVNDIVKKTGACTAPDIVTRLLDILSALAECHSRGIFHRDITPRNVLVDPNGRAVLIDFGLGYLAELNEETRLTSQPMGTPGYSPPEISIEPLMAKPTIDVFGVGALGIYMLTGRPPQLGSPLAVQHAPPALVSVLQRAVDADPSRRFQTVDAMAAVLKTAFAPSLPSVLTTNVPSVGTMITDEQCLEILGISPNASLDKRDRAMIAQFEVAATRILSVDGDSSPRLALLLTATRYKFGSHGYSTLCESDELLRALGDLIAAVHDATELPSHDALNAAFKKAIQAGWLKVEERDTWHPGMASGSGMRDFYLPTGVGYRWLKQNAGFHPPVE